MNKKEKDEVGSSFEKVNPFNEFILPERRREDIFYCNIARLSVNMYDVRLDLGRRSRDCDMPHVGDVTVMMSPEHAKDLLILLVRTLGEYEQKYGNIPSEYEVAATVREKVREEVRPIFHQKLDDVNN